MRYRFLIYFAIFICPLSAEREARLLARASSALLQSLQRAICMELRAGEKSCSVTIEHLTYHQLNDQEYLWAISWRANTIFQRKGEDASTMRDVLEKSQVLLLDIFSDHFTGVAYFRARTRDIEQITPAAFSMAALNTQYKAVARLSYELVEQGDFSCTLPEKWQTQGISASDRGEITLSFIAPPKTTDFRLSLLTLDDTPLSGIHFESCLVESRKGVGDCSKTAFQLSPGRQTVRLKLAAGKKLKSAQPVFKLVLSEPDSKKALLDLAIPYKPSPNYLVFGVAGFLFGGLVAVMAMMLRRNPSRN